MTVSKRSLRIGGNMLDKNKNGIPDKIENFALLVVSIILVVASVPLLSSALIGEGFAKFMIIVGIAGMLGDEVVKKVLLRK